MRITTILHTLKLVAQMLDEESSYQEGFNHLIEFSSDITKFQGEIQKHQAELGEYLEGKGMAIQKDLLDVLKKMKLFISDASNEYEVLVNTKKDENNRIAALNGLEKIAKQMNPILDEFIDKYSGMANDLDKEFKIGVGKFIKAIDDYLYRESEFGYGGGTNEWITAVIDYSKKHQDIVDQIQSYWFQSVVSEDGTKTEDEYTLNYIRNEGSLPPLNAKSEFRNKLYDVIKPIVGSVSKEQMVEELKEDNLVHFLKEMGINTNRDLKK